MKKINLLAVTAAAMLMACTGNKPADNQKPTSESDKDSLEQVSEQKSGREGYTFKASFHKDENGQCDALLLTCQSEEKSQQFTFEFNWPKDESLLGESGEITENDINFDGIPDVMVYLGDFGVNPGLFPTMFYGACIWDAETESFEQVKEFEGIANPKIDAESKTITSEYANPMDDVFHEVYAWKDGKLVLTESSSSNQLEDEEE